jgi:predicted N-acetyltransferase YhbS
MSSWRITTTADAARIHQCLVASGMLVHRRRCYEDVRHVTLADVQELLAQPALTTWSLLDGDDAQGFAITSIVNAVGRLHFFVVRPDTDLHAAEMLLTHLQHHWTDERVTLIRQTRLDPISGVFRVEQAREWLTLFAEHGFVAGEIAGNMECALSQFHWTEKLQASDEALRARDIIIRPACVDDAPAISALNHAEGLALWDYHLRATTVFERMHVAVRAGHVVGYANFFAARWDTELPEFGPLLVAGAYRKTGLGSVLTARALLHAQAQSKQRVRLSTLRPTFAFYRPLGFEVTVMWQEQLSK